MQKWEYRENYYGKRHAEPESNIGWHYDPGLDDLARTEGLAMIGRQGWELVAVSEDSPGIRYHFKRPLE